MVSGLLDFSASIVHPIRKKLEVAFAVRFMSLTKLCGNCLRCAPGFLTLPAGCEAGANDADVAMVMG